MSRILSISFARNLMVSGALSLILAAGIAWAEPTAAPAATPAATPAPSQAPAAAAVPAACKGQAQEVCEAREDCRWVKGYTRKDGAEVAGHCRVSAKKKDDGADSSASRAPTPPAAPAVSGGTPAS